MSHSAIICYSSTHSSTMRWGPSCSFSLLWGYIEQPQPILHFFHLAFVGVVSAYPFFLHRISPWATLIKMPAMSTPKAGLVKTRWYPILLCLCLHPSLFQLHLDQFHNLSLPLLVLFISVDCLVLLLKSNWSIYSIFPALFHALTAQGSFCIKKGVLAQINSKSVHQLCMPPR